MCERKIKRITRGSQLSRQREARRLQRIQRMTPSPAVRDVSHNAGLPPIVLPIDKALQNKVILELAWKTVALMHKNKLIQQKIIALQKETSEFVATIMSNPVNRQHYLNNMHAQTNSAVLPQHITVENTENKHVVIKSEPDA